MSSPVQTCPTRRSSVQRGRSSWFASLTVLLAAALTGCHVPGKPLPGTTPKRPDQILGFEALYAQNCAACHGPQGRGGAAISLASPVYVAYAGEQNIANVTAQGIGGSLMPGFARAVGGELTDEQIDILAKGIVGWGGSQAQQVAQQHPPPYFSNVKGDPGAGLALFKQDCLSCHKPVRGSILDPVYLRLISDGGLRTWMVVGKPAAGMPDWHSYRGGPLTDSQIADLVSFLSSLREPVIQPQPPALPPPPGAPSAQGEPSPATTAQQPASAPAPRKP